MPRPRDLDHPDYLATRDRIFALMGMDVHGGGAD
jgi:NitT/TauT family transport system ATP-binding protein